MRWSHCQYRMPKKSSSVRQNSENATAMHDSSAWLFCFDGRRICRFHFMRRQQDVRNYRDYRA